MSYPKSLTVSDCGLNYVNGVYRKQINKKNNTHKYIKFCKNQPNDDEHKNDTNNKTIKIEISQNKTNGEIIICSKNNNLYKSSFDGKWSSFDKNWLPLPQISISKNKKWCSIVQCFPRFKATKQFIKKYNNNKKQNKQNDYLFKNLNVKHYIKDARITERFVLFYKDVFSQWFPCEMIINNIKYQNCEQWMMAQKARLFGDEYYLDLILKTGDPAKVKKYGRGVRGFNESIWIKNRDKIVYDGNWYKFNQNKILKKKLLSYDKKLIFVEASAVDKIWGIGLSVNDPNAAYQRNWRGKNLLGYAITKVRDDIMSQNNNDNDE